MDKISITSFQGQYRFLSNFYPSLIMWEGHAYQGAKCFDVKDREMIRRLPKPGDAKRAGRKVKIGPYRNWDMVKVPIMLHLLQLKFALPDLRERLGNTYPAELIEGNYWGDTFWGVCDGTGENWLGRLLMQVRKEIVRQ